MKRLNCFSRIAETEFGLATNHVNILYYDLPRHFHDEYRSYESPRLCTILSGTKQVSINQSEQFSYQKDQCVLLPPHSNVYMSMSESTQALVYEFSDELIEEVRAKVSEQLLIEDTPGFDTHAFHLESVQQRLSVLHHRVQDVLLNEKESIGFLLDLTCQELVYELLKRQGCQKILLDNASHPVTKAIRLMKSNQGPLSISQLAEEVNMSLPNFSQKFKLVTSHTPKEYATKIRLHQARHFLKQLSVTDTAYELGYENISHFIRLFKKEFGLTPKQFKLNNTGTHYS
ncbi:helix-turn-helix domain-containing protein [Vibrio mangrovi]|uniref:HTH-type transcriptional activator RhaS n=1 Tax=Vibrio mangrovi TaxID=474394 RepID=A0A1Y6IZ19_9VIBR|nr:helix-turn-helix domain-containing protein [Vibrio mangrovi]MDW6005264.1 helix-turn-helix domain-containing protein [Vibrio mangrovi]SMS02889.1 HTH-type transcriptional activator RhaS [Vibrio mangrovi]